MDAILAHLSDAIAYADGILAYLLIPGLLFVGLFLTLRLRFIQLRRLRHGLQVTGGQYDDPNETGDVSHFQALTTALSATVGVGNIAGVAMAIHYGGPGALFWMWLTAFFGMAVKYAECTLSVHFRSVHADDRDGAVSGGPMYYIERGLKMKPLAVFFAIGLVVTSFFTGNAIQANTLSSVLYSSMGISPWVSGAVSACLVAAVILGGIRRIGRITSILAPAMAFLYVSGALAVLAFHIGDIPGAFAQVFSQAFTPIAGVTGVGAGAFMTVLTMGVKRGLFSNEAGQGSAPIAHAAAKTEEPVSEGVVALLEPLIDTLIICTLTGLVILTTGVWDARFPTKMSVDDVAWGAPSLEVREGDLPKEKIRYNDGFLDRVYIDEAQRTPFDGRIVVAPNGAVQARGRDGVLYPELYGEAVSLGAPMTRHAFEQGLAPLGNWGGWIVTLCVILFALSTAISWSYYGDRCVMYLIGSRAILPYRIAFCTLHFVGATAGVEAVWGLGDVALTLATLPNILALLLLSGTLAKLTDSYFERKPYLKHQVVEADMPRAKAA